MPIMYTGVHIHATYSEPTGQNEKRQQPDIFTTVPIIMTIPEEIKTVLIISHSLLNTHDIIVTLYKSKINKGECNLLMSTAVINNNAEYLYI